MSRRASTCSPCLKWRPDSEWERAPQGQAVLGHVGKQAQDGFLRIECLVINLLRRQWVPRFQQKGKVEARHGQLLRVIGNPGNLAGQPLAERERLPVGLFRGSSGFRCGYPGIYGPAYWARDVFSGVRTYPRKNPSAYSRVI